MEDAYERIARTRELVDCFVQVDGGVKAENVRAVHDAGRGPARRRHRHLRLRGPAAGLPAAGTSAGMSSASGRSSSQREAAGQRRIRSRRSARSSSRTARSSARARPRRTAATARSSRSTPAGEQARGATLYVTMEPCAHHGTTPPCVDAVLAAGIARVVAGSLDPNPEAGGGLERLREAGRRGRARRQLRGAAPERGVAHVGRRSGARSSPTRRRSRSTAASPCPASAGSRARRPAGSCTSCAPPPTPSRSGWARCGSRTRGSTRATSTRDAPAAAARVRQRPAPRGLRARAAHRPARRGAARARRRRRPVAAARGRPDARAAFLEAGLVDKLLLFVAPMLAGDGPVRRRPGSTRPLRLTHLTSSQVGEDVLLEAYLREP